MSKYLRIKSGEASFQLVERFDEFKAVGATQYISGLSAKAYMDLKLFEEQQINVLFLIGWLISIVNFI